MDPADTGERTGSDTNPPTDDADRLRHRIARRADGPDRHTVFPAVVDEDRELSTWLTVDATCVVDLEAAR